MALTVLWFNLRVLMMVQRLPLVVLIILMVAPLWAWYRMTKQHRLFLWVSKRLSRLFLFCSGLKISGADQLKSLTKTAVILNHYVGVDALILFAYSPSKSILFLDPSFFPKTIIKSLLESLGWFPKESHFDYRRFKTQSFIADPYAKAGFALFETVIVHRQSYESIPYVLMLSIKHQLPVTYVLLRGTHRNAQGSLFYRIPVYIEVMAQVPAFKRSDLALIQYRRQILKMKEYEQSRRQFQNPSQLKTYSKKRPPKKRPPLNQSSQPGRSKSQKPKQDFKKTTQKTNSDPLSQESPSKLDQGS